MTTEADLAREFEEAFRMVALELINEATGPGVNVDHAVAFRACMVAAAAYCARTWATSATLSQVAPITAKQAMLAQVDRAFDEMAVKLAEQPDPAMN